MSIDSCYLCGSQIDTDFDLYCYCLDCLKPTCPDCRIVIDENEEEFCPDCYNNRLKRTGNIIVAAMVFILIMVIIAVLTGNTQFVVDNYNFYYYI